jgi:hypothetical protein
MQTLKIDALFKVHLADAGRLQRPVPAVAGVEIGIDRYGFGLLDDAERLEEK